MLAEEIMTTDVVTSPHDATLETAAKRMIDQRVGSVIVTHEGDPVAILTETDALEAGAVTGRPFGEITLAEVASQPLITIAPDTTVRKAVAVMGDEDVKKLPVVADLDLQGILTRSDVVSHYDDFIDEAYEIAGQRDHWEARRADPEEF